NSVMNLYFAVLWLGNIFFPGAPLGYHVFSLSLHIAATVLLLAAIPRLLPGTSPLAAGVGACLFAVHPVHSEAVAWITPFTHLMATVLVLASYLVHHRYRRTRNPATLALAGLLFLVALFGNEMAVGFPFFILIHDWVRYDRPRPLGAVPYFLVLGVYIVLRKIVLTDAFPLVLSDPDAWLRLPVFLAEYLRHLILPWPQPLYLAMPSGWGISLGSGLAAGLLAALFVFLLTRPAEKRQGPLLAAAWIFAALMAPLAATFNPSPLFALRTLYMPSVGIALLVAWLVGNHTFLQGKVGLAVIAAALLLALGATVAANRDWLDDGRVYRRIIASNPGDFRGHLGLGGYLERTGKTDEAIRLYEEAIALAGPRQKAGPLERLGLLLGQAGDSARSLEIYWQVTELEPGRSSAWVGVGNNLWFMGRLSEAVDAYRKAHAADPGNRQACHNLAQTLMRLGKTEEAARFAACAVKQP
ncbi:MAG: tetratricopeptide repeat protein, partial [Rhodospirillales bacterium]|nr:tetratricopeptide repeat protein [Rhodospirillales bacterium]